MTRLAAGAMLRTASFALLTLPCACNSSSPPPAEDSTGVAAAVDVAGSNDPAPSAEPLLLRWKFHDQDQFEWNYESGMELEGPSGGQIVKATVTVRVKFDVRVNREADDLFQMRYTLSRLQLTSDAPEMPIDYDSDRPKGQPPGDSEQESEEEQMSRLVEETLAETLKLELNTVVDARGRIMHLDVSGVDQSALPGQGLEGLLFLAKADGLNSLHAGGFVLLPERPIAPESAWEQSTDVPCRFGTLRFTHRATHVGPEVVDAVELQKFQMSITASAVVNPILVEMLKLEDAGGTGELYFNEQDGQLDSYRYRSNITMTVVPPGEGQEPLAGRITYVSNTFLKRVP